MSQSKQQFTVMFADVAGSTHLYEKLGDSQANSLIGETIAIMSDITTQNNGVLIKTIGDEVMTRFEHANHGIQAACMIQEKFDQMPAKNGVSIAIRIGLHSGPALLQPDGDLFGDAVNVAARMAGIAKANQVITSEDTVNMLNNELQEKCREFDRTTVRGKSGEMLIYEVVWEPEDVTRMTSLHNFLPQIEKPSILKVRYQDIEKNMLKDSGSFLLGRGPQCDLVVNARNASRVHAKIEYRRGKFILLDESTNGTYVRTEDGREIFLRREDLPLNGQGVISLGERSEKNSHLVYFKV